MSKEHILVIDDERGIRDSLQMVLEYAGYDVSLAPDGEQGLTRLREARPPVDLVLLDIKMPGKDGLQVLEEIKAARRHLEVVMISAHADVAAAVRATRSGAFDLVEKPLDQDRLLLVIRNALEKGRLARDNQRLARMMSLERKILGESQAIQDLRQAIETAAPTQARVLIYGENGSGKELVARALHFGSPRALGPFVEVNCAAIPRELIESELFGHRKGAFTGATSDRAGKFEQADGGTLFLDEIGDMPLEAQAKVLRVLEEERVSRVGASSSTAVDVRVVSATNRDLPEMISEGEFREDLYYRLNVIPLRVPAMRERLEDVPLLAQHFLAEMCDRNGLPRRRLTEAALEVLSRQAWPGNVRQLRNLMERLAIMARGEEIGRDEVNRFLADDGGGGRESDLITSIESFEEFQREAERRYLEHHLRRNAWNVKRTAELLGMQRSNLYKKIEKHGLR
jgi:two-component system nitrogen regulation response regulator NtrX